MLLPLEICSVIYLTILISIAVLWLWCLLDALRIAYDELWGPKDTGAPTAKAAAVEEGRSLGTSTERLWGNCTEVGMGTAV